MDVDVAVPLLLALLAVVAASVRRWWAAVFPLVAVPLFYAGLRNRWWGDGVGDGWQYAAAAVTVAGILGALVGVVIGRFLADTVRR